MKGDVLNKGLAVIGIQYLIVIPLEFVPADAGPHDPIAYTLFFCIYGLFFLTVLGAVIFLLGHSGPIVNPQLAAQLVSVASVYYITTGLLASVTRTVTFISQTRSGALHAVNWRFLAEGWVGLATGLCLYWIATRPVKQFTH